MSIITITKHGNFAKTSKFMKKCAHLMENGVFDQYGIRGVEALKAYTPKDTGHTADSWTYKVVMRTNQIGIRFYNTYVNQGHNIAILLQIGHATGTGGWVEGVDYINPALEPIFTEMCRDLQREVRH